MAEQPLLSIIFTSYTIDRLNDIFELLGSIRAQTYTNIETIFVAERSAELLEKVKAYAAEKAIPNMSVVFNDGEPGLSAARNLGIIHANGDIIGFVDDDVILFPDWAEETVKTFQDESIIGVTGPALPLWEHNSMSWFPEEFYWIISCTAWTGWDEVTEARSAYGHSMSFKKEAFSVAGPFLNTLGYHKPMAEDLEFSLRVKSKTGKRIVFNPSTKVWHKVHNYRLTWKFIATRAHHIGVSRRLLKKVYPQNSNLLSLEHSLLRRILGLLLNMPGDFLRSPTTAWRKFSLIIIALVFIAYGYLFSRISLDSIRVKDA